MFSLDKHLVTTKAAIYTPDHTEVLVVEYPGRGYGLPGGHIDAGETPDQAMKRELDEELGITPEDLKHRDFFMHNHGKIVLGFVGTMPKDALPAAPNPKMEVGTWLTHEAFESIDIDPGYRDFALANWPAN